MSRARRLRTEQRTPSESGNRKNTRLGQGLATLPLSFSQTTKQSTQNDAFGTAEPAKPCKK